MHVYNPVQKHEHNKTPGPDGFQGEFYQQFWVVIKGDLMRMFHDLRKGDLPLFSLNFGVIMLLPKTQDDNKIQQYRPNCLLNVSFKIFMKVVTIQLGRRSRNQSYTDSVYLRSKNSRRVVILHKPIHELHRKNKSGEIFKIDFKKGYDKLMWNFLMQMLRLKGFSHKWIEWIKSFISGGSIAVNVNDEVGPYFQTKKGLTQGDHFCPSYLIQQPTHYCLSTEQKQQVS